MTLLAVGTALWVLSSAFAFGVFAAADRHVEPSDPATHVVACADGFHRCKWCSKPIQLGIRGGFDKLFAKSIVWPLVIIAAAGNRMMTQRLEVKHESKQTTEAQDRESA